jgi:hypothetical protein
MHDMGRRSDLTHLVDALDGSVDAKKRMRAITRAATNDLSVGDAAAELDVSPQRFHELRETMLQAGLAALEAKSAGRPKATPDHESELIAEIAVLKARINYLEVAREADGIRMRVEALFGKRTSAGKQAKKNGRR